MITNEERREGGAVSICPFVCKRYSNKPVECCKEQCGQWLGGRCSVARLSEIVSRRICTGDNRERTWMVSDER